MLSYIAFNGPGWDFALKLRDQQMETDRTRQDQYPKGIEKNMRTTRISVTQSVSAKTGKVYLSQ